MPEARVASVHDLADGQMKQVSVGETDVLLSRIDGQYHACGAHCTHYGAPLAEGALLDGCVVCPWHHARFDVRTGALADPPALDSLPRYEVRVEGEDVFVRVPDDAEETPQPAAYRESGGAPPPMAQEKDDRTFVILGAGAAGQAAAEALREAGFHGRVVLVTREMDRPYDRTVLSKDFMAGAAEPDWLPLRDADFYSEHDLELVRGRTVTRLDAEGRTIHFEAGEPLRYDRCLVATGGVPRTLDVPGSDHERVHTLRSWADARRIVEQAERGQRVVVVGSSFIGMETAANLTTRGLEVAVVSTGRVPFEGTLGEDVGRVLQRAHTDNGVIFHLGTTVERIEEAGEGLRVTLENGETLAADFVLVGIGVTPATDFIEGVERHEKDGGVLADAHLRIGPDLWAAGDIAHFPDPRTGRRIRVEHWRLAQQHGRVAAFAMAGREAVYDGVPFFWSGQFDLKPRYLGHAGDWDEVVVDGSLEEAKFIAYYLADGQVRAACGLGRDHDMAALHALLLAGRAPSAADVRGGFEPAAALQNA